MTTANDLHYSLDIRWDADDHIYVAHVPELPGCAAHGVTYEEVIASIEDAIEAYVDDEDPATLPVPRFYNAESHSVW